jgi:hypothetical protein
MASSYSASRKCHASPVTIRGHFTAHNTASILAILGIQDGLGEVVSSKSDINCDSVPIFVNRRKRRNEGPTEKRNQT